MESNQNCTSIALIVRMNPFRVPCGDANLDETKNTSVIAGCYVILLLHNSKTNGRMTPVFQDDYSSLRDEDGYVDVVDVE